MFKDFRTVQDDTDLECDLCVIGAGAAGITIARELTGKNIRVCVVESGGFDIEVATQALYGGVNTGLPYYRLDASRLRYFGGTTNHWNGLCAPLDEMDFQVRPWVPYSGWPITRADLDSYYKRALEVCELGPYVFDESIWEHFEFEHPSLMPEKLQSHFWQRSPPTRFGQVYRDELKTAGNVTVLLNANVTNIASDEAGEKVTHVDISTLDGSKGRVLAKRFVLACGGMENVRLMLVSNHVHQEGLGNDHGLVGRFFMEHIRARSGTIGMANVGRLLKMYANKHIDGVGYRPGMKVSEAEQKQKKILNICATFEDEYKPIPSIQSGRRIVSAIKEGGIPEDLGEDIRVIMGDLYGVADFAECRLKGQPRCESVFYLRTRQEQAPNPDSRVTLSRDMDVLGMPRLSCDWRLSELDKQTAMEMAVIVGGEFGRLNIGRIQLAEWLEDDSDSGWSGSYHHMGTTRMANDPRKGVVNSDCRVHGMGNLYVSGSSVFPTSGFVNPTFTIVALALRLADHLSMQNI